MLQEREIRGVSGWVMLTGLIAVIFACIAGIVALAAFEVVDDYPLLVVAGILVIILAGVRFFGLTVVNPNEARVLPLFGVYKGSIKTAGFWWVNPLTSRRRLSLRVRNFESGKLKVNDHDGNPIEIAAVVVWRRSEERRVGKGAQVRG